jgi:transposase
LRATGRATGSRANKTAHAAEHERPDVGERRVTWRAARPRLDAARLVFIDGEEEQTTIRWIVVPTNGAATAMARRHGRCRRGRRLRLAVPHGPWTTTTCVAGLTTGGLVAPWVLDSAINRDAFEVYFEVYGAEVLVPELRPGDIVVRDNLSCHKGPKMRQMIAAAGATLLHLPPYAPDLNPIKMACATLKASPRHAAERTVTGLGIAIGQLLDSFTPGERRNYSTAAGYPAR